MKLTFASPLLPSKLRNSGPPSSSLTLRQPKPNAIFRFFTSPNPKPPEFDPPPRPSSPQLPSTSTSKRLHHPPARPDPNVVLVLGASGLLGRQIVNELLKAPGRIVIACVRSRSAASDARLDEIAMRTGQQQADGHLGYRPARLKLLVAELSSRIPYICEEAKRQDVGTVVFAASGGRTSKPGEIDNLAVRSLVGALEPFLGANGDARELHLFDFQSNPSQTVLTFRSVDDRVMGGVSISQMSISQQGDTALFHGNVTTANKGGFAQVRASFGTDTTGQSLPVDLSNYAGLMIRCRGDGRRYKINLKDTEQPEKVFQASFGTVKGEWQAIRLPFSEFIPVRRGRIAYRDGPGPGIYASVLDTTNLLSVGLVVSKIEPGGGVTPGFESGPFELEVSRITAYRASTPRFLLVSSAAVTRPFWSEKQKALAPSAAEIPIVRLNPSNILGHKLAGENAVRRRTIPWAIVRLTGLNDELASGHKLLLRQGDTLYGTLSRTDAARGIVAALYSTASTWKTFELGAENVAEDEENVLTEVQFAALSRDMLESQHGPQTDHLV